jgi:hypothetical protein
MTLAPVRFFHSQFAICKVHLPTAAPGDGDATQDANATPQGGLMGTHCAPGEMTGPAGCWRKASTVPGRSACCYGSWCWSLRG